MKTTEEFAQPYFRLISVRNLEESAITKTPWVCPCCGTIMEMKPMQDSQPRKIMVVTKACSDHVSPVGVHV